VETVLSFIDENVDLLAESEKSEYFSWVGKDRTWERINHPPGYVDYIEVLVNRIKSRKRDKFYDDLDKRMAQDGNGDLFPKVDPAYFNALLRTIKLKSRVPLREYFEKKEDPQKRILKEFDPEKHMTFEDRTGIAQLLADAGEHNKAWRFQRCNRDAVMLQCEQEDRLFYHPFKCEQRICPVCSFFYYKKVMPRLRKLVNSVFDYSSKKRLMFLTLTKKKDISYSYDKEPLFGNPDVHVTRISKVDKSEIDPDSVKQFFTYVRTFINKFYPKKKGQGALGVLEIGPSQNVHCHLLVYGDFYPKSQLRQAWYQITGDSYIVDIREVKDPQGGLAEIGKYIYKPPEFFEWISYVDYLLAIAGVRRIHTFGIFYNMKQFPLEKKDRLVCPYCGASIIWKGVQLDGWTWEGRPESIFEAKKRIKSKPAEVLGAEVCLN